MKVALVDVNLKVVGATLDAAPSDSAESLSSALRGAMTGSGAGTTASNGPIHFGSIALDGFEGSVGDLGLVDPAVTYGLCLSTSGEGPVNPLRLTVEMIRDGYGDVAMVTLPDAASNTVGDLKAVIAAVTGAPLPCGILAGGRDELDDATVLADAGLADRSLVRRVSRLQGADGTDGFSTGRRASLEVVVRALSTGADVVFVVEPGTTVGALKVGGGDGVAGSFSQSRGVCMRMLNSECWSGRASFTLSLSPPSFVHSLRSQELIAERSDMGAASIRLAFNYRPLDDDLVALEAYGLVAGSNPLCQVLDCYLCFDAMAAPEVRVCGSGG